MTVRVPRFGLILRPILPAGALAAGIAVVASLALAAPAQTQAQQTQSQQNPPVPSQPAPPAQAQVPSFGGKLEAKYVEIVKQRP